MQPPDQDLDLSLGPVMAEAAPAVLMIATRGDSGWTIDWVNHRWEEVTGQSRDVAIGMPLTEHFPLVLSPELVPDGVEPGTSETASVTVNGLAYGGRWGLESDRTFWVVNLARFSAQRCGLFAVDQTPQYRYAMMLEDAIETRKKLQESVSQVVHELKQPLSSILGFAEVLSETKDPSEVSEFAQLIHAQADDLQFLIEDLLTANLTAAGKLRMSFDIIPGQQLTQLVEDLIRSFNRSTLIRLGSIEGELRTDPRRLGQVVRGLIQNAIKYGGPNIEVRIGQSSGLATIEVADNGHGVPPEDVHRIFEPFTGRDAASGTGIGLTVARSIVSDLGGTLEYRDGHPGARFMISLPLHGDTTPDSVQIDYEAEAAGLQRAMVQYRADEVRQRLNRLGMRAPLAEVIDRIIRPVMYEIGDRWQRGEISVAQEHHASAAVSSWLSVTLGKYPARIEGPVICACAPGNEHENGIAAVAATLAKAGFNIIYLGRSAPVESLLSAVEANRAIAVLLSLTTVTDIQGLKQVSAEIELSARGTFLGFGGRLFVDGYPHKGLPGNYLGSDPQAAVDAMLALTTEPQHG